MIQSQKHILDLKLIEIIGSVLYGSELFVYKGVVSSNAGSLSIQKSPK